MATSRLPREGEDLNDGENIRLQKTATGTVHKMIGDSQFYSKHGIKPIGETLDNSTNSADLESPIKMKNVRKLHDGCTKFPKLAECAHFHYDFTELGVIQVSLNQENQENLHKCGEGEPEIAFYLNVTSNDKTWIIRRNYDNFRTFDKQLHKCIFDRKFSLLPDLKRKEHDSSEDDKIVALQKQFALYLKRFSAIAGNMINCGPILSWLEMDNRGNRLMVTDESAINTPAVSAGHVNKRYTAQAPDEISLQVGDIISIIDMPPKEETGWWRGKREYEVGFFPSECVELISDKSIRESMESKLPETSTRPVLRRRGKLISILRSLFKTRPTRTQLQRTGIVKQRIFGCDLGEHLLNSGLDVPSVLTMCTEVIEEHGIVDGIYRLSGVASNIQKLRNDFDEEKEPNLTDETYLQDIHSISSLLKAYFRELPNPLLTYQLYEKYSEAVTYDDNKLIKIHDVIQQLPPPHYRTAEFLFKHLNRVSKHGRYTGMHCKNLAIVWAPNLMRSKELETMCNTAMLQGVGVQAIVTEYLIQYADVIFSDKLQNVPTEGSIGRRARPKSLAISTPTKLLSLEEAREQMLASSSNESPKQKFIEVGGGPANLPKEYHTVIEIPGKKKRQKERKVHSASVSDAPSGPSNNTALGGSGWRNIFSRKKQDSVKSTSSEARVGVKISDDNPPSYHRKLRTVRSADSLLSAASSAEANNRTSDPLDGKPTGIFKSKDEDFPDVRPKALTYERPINTKYKSNRRTRSHDLTQSESDVSEQEEVPKMDTDIVPRPSSATAELTHHVPEIVSDQENTGSNKFKKSKSSKESKKSKKKQRSSSAGQPIEGIPMMTDESDRIVRPVSHGHKLPQFTDGYAPEPPPRPQPPPSPSLKDRLVQALTPTSPRKKIKGPAPSPPSSPPPVLESKSSKKKSKGKLAKDTVVSDAYIQPHSKLELLTGKPPEHSMTLTTMEIQKQHKDMEQSQMIQLSPIEEALNSDMSITPDVELNGLVAKLQHNKLQEIELQGAEGAEAEMASVDNLTYEEVFHEQNFVAITPDLEGEFESRKDALANLDIVNSANNAIKYNPRPFELPSEMNSNANSGQIEKQYNTLQADVSGATDSTLCDTDMSMSLDSLLKQVVGNDHYHSEFGSNASFKTFGKANEISVQSEQGSNLVSSANSSQQIVTIVQQEGYEVNNIVDSHIPPPVPKPRASKGKQKKRYELQENIQTDSVEQCTTPTSGILETDIDTFEIDDKGPLAFDERVHILRGKEMSPQSEEEDLQERHNYIAPLPGDIKLMSQYPDLIAPNLLAQIDLQETEVQYVDPHDTQIDEYYCNTPDLYTEAEQNTVQDMVCDKFDSINDLQQEVEENDVISLDHQEQQLPDIMPGIEETFGLKSEPGRIVIRKPLEDTNEGSTFIPVKTKVVPPPKQFAYSAPPIANTVPEKAEFVEDDDETAIDTPSDTPSDEFPPPPPSIASDNNVQNTFNSMGYGTERSSSNSPNFTDKQGQFQEKFQAVSQPVTIEESETVMTLSPVSSVKTSESDVAMLTSSVESDNLLDGMHQSRMSVDDKELALLPPINSKSTDSLEHGMVFQMDDVKSKSVDSLNTMAISVEDNDLSLKEHISDEVKEEKEFVIEDTESHLDYFFTYEDNRDNHHPSLQDSNVQHSTDRNMQNITIDTSFAHSYYATTEESAPSSSSSIVKEDVHPNVTAIQEGENARKSSPVKRKKSVKELLSRFEVVTSSPPSDGEAKVKPPVFQKPKIVRLHSLNKSDDYDDDIPYEDDCIHIKSPKIEDSNLMSVSCPDASRLLTLSPKSIDISEVDPPNYLQRSNTDIDPYEPKLDRNRPSVRNKIKQFESSESLTSDSERSKSRSPGRQIDISPVGRNKPPVKERAFSPVPPAKPIIIHEKKPLKSDIPQYVNKQLEVSTDSPSEGQKSNISPKYSIQQSETVRNPTTFHMRSASSGMASNLIDIDNVSENTPLSQSMIERKRKFESSTDSNISTMSLPYRRASVENKSVEDDYRSTTFEQSKDTGKGNSVDYSRSASVPNALEKTDLKIDYTSSQGNSNPNVDNEVSVLKPSQLFSRRSKRKSEPPPVPPHNVVKTDDDNTGNDVMRASFSDRRKLFESSTDSGVTSGYSSLKKLNVHTLPKQNADKPKDNVYFDSSSVDESVINYNANTNKRDSPYNSDGVSYSDYAAKARNYGQKTIVIQSKDSGMTKSNGTHEMSTDSSQGIQSSSRTKVFQKEQKENVKPPVVFKTFEKDIGIDQKERSGTVKDLWKKFEQQNN